MAEEATLIFKAETKDLVTADERLNKINLTGKKTEAVTNKVESSFISVSRSIGKMAAEVSDLEKTIGLSSNELERFRLSQQGATKSQLDAVAAIQARRDETIRANKAGQNFNLTAKKTESLNNEVKSSFITVSQSIRKMAEETSFLEKTVGLSSEELERFKLSQLGANKAQLDAVKAIQARREAITRSNQATVLATDANRNLARGMGRNNAAIQNTAFQLQDIVVQLEQGTSISRTFGQQLPQLLGGFGALGAVAGVVAGLGFALGGVLVSGLDDSAKASKLLEKSLEGLDEVITITDSGVTQLSAGFKRLSNIGGVAFSATLKEAISDSKDAIEAARKEAERLAKSISPNELGGRFDPTKIRFELLTGEFRKGRITLKEYSTEIDKISLKSDDLTKDFRNLRVEIGKKAAASNSASLRLKELKKIQDGNISTSNEHQSSIDRIVMSLKAQADAANDSGNSTSFYRAQQLGATQAELDRISSLQGVIDKQKELNDTQKEAEKAAAREAEIENARQTAFQNRLNSTEDFLRSENTVYKDAYNERLSIINTAENQGTLDEDEAYKLRLKNQEIYNKQRLSSMSSTFGDISGLMSSENSKLFAIGKAAAIAQATVEGTLAVQRALASIPFPLGFAAAALVGAASAVNIAKIASAPPPGRALGGQVTEGQPYRVGEFGPETFVPSSSGRIMPSGAANDSKIEVVNNIKVIGGSADAKVTTSTTRSDTKIVQDIVIDLMGNPSSPARQALQRTSNVQPRGSR